MKLKTTHAKTHHPTEHSQREARRRLAGALAGEVVKAMQMPKVDHPFVEKFGQGVGLALGLMVTETLALSPSWNAALRDKAGKPVSHIAGADRMGNYDLRKRHQEVVGPQVAALVEKMKPGVVHDLLAALGRGATAAPGTGYRMEALTIDAFSDA